MAMTIFRGKPLPKYKITMESCDSPTPLELECSLGRTSIKVKIGSAEIVLPSQLLLRAVATLTKD
jgi:hypothetical protein